MATDPARDAAYADVFASRDAALVVMDDMQEFINGMPIEHQAGAWRLYGHLQLRTSAKRRAQRREPKKGTKLT